MYPLVPFSPTLVGEEGRTAFPTTSISGFSTPGRHGTDTHWEASPAASVILTQPFCRRVRIGLLGVSSKS